MPTATEKMQQLIEKVEAYRTNLSNKILLEALGFFALINLLKKIQDTEDAVAATLQDYIGAMFEMFEQMFDSKTIKRVTNIISRVNNIISQAFNPEPNHILTPSFATAS